jgi:hypothetical protein
VGSAVRRQCDPETQLEGDLNMRSLVKPEIAAAFEAAVNTDDAAYIRKRRSDVDVQRDAVLLMKQVETFIENLPDQTISVLELYQEIAGKGWQSGEL